MTSFVDTQLDFIRHIKNPAEHPFDYGIESRRMQIYQDLFFNNVRGFIDSAFPVLQSLYNEQDWLALIRVFFATHACRSPYFVDISKAFVEFLSHEYQTQVGDPPFMLELAHYEWLELDISVRKQQLAFTPITDKLPTKLAISDLAELVSYQYPVHQISSDFQPTDPGEPIFLVVYRDDQDEVNFTLVNQVSAHLLQLIQQADGGEVDELITQMQQALSHLDAEQVKQGTEQTLEQLWRQQILLEKK